MLDFFRRGSDTFIVKALFGFLFLSFIVWGVGDIFRSNKDNSIATLGRSKIPFSEFQRHYQQEMSRIQAMTGNAISAEQIAAMQLHRMVAENLINQRLFEMQTADLGLRVNDDVVIDTIRQDRTFQNEKGEFDRERLTQILYSNNISENEYFSVIKRGIASEYLATALASQHITPRIFAQTLLQYRNESRKTDILEIPLSKISAASLPAPTDAELKTFHDDNKTLFSLPEYRAFTYITLGYNDIVDDIVIEEDKLKAEYDSRKEEFQKPEQRVVEQVLFDNESAARQAAEKLGKGDAFSSVGKVTNLGKITKGDSVKEIADAVFSLAKDAYSQPVQGPFGWYIFHVTDILPAAPLAFEEVRPDLEKEMKGEMAAEKMESVVKELEDAFASGENLEDVAKKHHLKLRSVEAINQEGELAGGTKVEELPEAANFMQMVFSGQPKEISPMTLTSDNSEYFAVRVDAVKKARVQKLEEVKDLAISKWKEAEQHKQLAELAKKAEKEAKSGKSLEAVASGLGLSVKKDVLIRRPAQGMAAPANDATYPEALQEDVFKQEIGGVTKSYLTDNGTYVVAAVRDVVPYDGAKKGSNTAALMVEIAKSSENDIFEQYNRYMRTQFPVSINEQLLNGVVQ